MELYSKEELLKELKKEYSCGGECDHCPEVLDAGSCAVLRCIRRIIDNTQPVEVPENAVNCVLTMFGECSYNKTGCSDCEIKVKIRKALSKRPQGEEWIDNFIKNYNASKDFQITDIRDREKLLDDLIPKGEWIRTGSLGNGNAQYECSNCHYGDEQAESQEVPYCWHCGAKMRKGGADAE